MWTKTSASSFTLDGPDAIREGVPCRGAEFKETGFSFTLPVSQHSGISTQAHIHKLVFAPSLGETSSCHRQRNNRL